MEVTDFMPEEVDVQKAVVEELAAEKVEQEERMIELEKENARLSTELGTLKAQIAEMKTALEKVGDVLATNSETSASNKVALIDRDVEIADRFEGETRDHVLEAVKAARDEAEKAGRTRRAQLLEAVLFANEPSGNLAKKRDALTKFFQDHQNILSGPVIAELERCGIPYKKGEEYLLTDEILKRMY